MKKLLLFLLLTSIAFKASSQTLEIPCSTEEDTKRLQEQYPNFFPSTDVFEQQIAADILGMRSQKMQLGEVTIPVVFHVIHDGDAVGTNENVPVAQILSQLQIINEDFGRTKGSRGFSTDARSVDTQIEWCLAEVAPDGSPTTGITRTDFGQAEWTNADFDQNVKPATSWDPTQYCNIWVTNLPGTSLGYAQFPVGSGLPGVPVNPIANTDGVVVDFATLGTIEARYEGTSIYLSTNNLGRTLTHELGHWLGLRHIWGDDNCGDDYCNDTPAQATLYFGCPTDTVSCDGVVDMIPNYMDYTDDACKNIFTNDQLARMNAVLSSSPRRMELLSSNKCTAYPRIQFVDWNTVAYEESATGSACAAFVDYPIDLRISAEPTEDAVVSISATGTATEGQDYTLIPNSLTFAANSTDVQTVLLRVYNDGNVEGEETLDLSFSISTTGDALPSTFKETHSVKIWEEDAVPADSRVVFFEEDFGNGLSTNIFDSSPDGGGIWELSTTGPKNWSRFGFVGPPNFDSKDNGFLMFDSRGKGDDGKTEFSSYYIGPIDCSAYSDVRLEFSSQTCLYNSDSLYVGATIDGGATVSTSELYAAGTQNACSADPAKIDLGFGIANNQPQVFILFRYKGDFDLWWMVDDIKLYSNNSALVQTMVNTPMPQEKPLGPLETAHFYDPVSGNIMMSIENTSNFDYGCVSVDVNRSGTGAELAWNSPTSDYIASKTFNVETEFDSPTGTYDIALYYTAAELNGWSAATGRPLADLSVIKTTGDITNPLSSDGREANLVSLDPYGADYIVRGSFSTGFSDFGVGFANAILPIELISFKGKDVATGILLEWQTASATNASHFELEHALNSDQFRYLATVETKPTSGLADYSYLDQKFGTGYNYYRLKMVDSDGDFSYSKIISVKIAREIMPLALYPNPVGVHSVLNINGQLAEHSRLLVFDAAGHLVKEMGISLSVGNNQLPIQFDGLASGVYFIKIRDTKQHFEPLRFIKL